MTTPFHVQGAFTSTLHHRHDGFRIWIILLTAAFFFIILAWYNVALAFFNYLTGRNSSGGTPITKEEINTNNREVFWGSLGFAAFWTILSILAFYVMDSMNLLEVEGGAGFDPHADLRFERGGRAEIIKGI